MKFPPTIGSILILTLLSRPFAYSAEDALDKSPAKKKKAIVDFPQDIILTSGDAFVLEAPKLKVSKVNEGKPLKRQWRKDDVALPGQTNIEYQIASVTHAHAGSYTVIFSGAEEIESAPVYISVVSYFANQSNGGYLSTPFASFTTAPYTVCGGTGFNKYKVVYPFDGPGTSPASSLYPNTSGETNLIVDTCTNLNGATLDTGIRISENFSNMTLRACSDDINCGVGNNLLSSCIVTGLLAGRTYRVGIHYKTNTIGTAPSVTFRWKYTDGFTW